jgi:hypothetical protein
VSEPVLVFVNERPVRLPAGASMAAAVAAFDPALAARLAAGEAQLTDGRGIVLAPDTPLFAGAILRCAVRARRGAEEADADA